MTDKHKVFVSYHHANDQEYRDVFEDILAKYDISVIKSVKMGDIDETLKTETVRQKIRDEYLKDSTVTVVLIGEETWKRKHVDWEIGSSLRHTQNNPRSGLLGIILPTYPRNSTTKYNEHTIPPRLHDNVNCGFATIYNWSTNPDSIQSWIHETFEQRFKKDPDNSRASFANNRSGSQWQD
ncbi:TIR domain-containing protein [Methanococcoides sp. SA1]|nr:TIR domain-containing protein [Methanococcoides sp. SA1]